MDDMFCYYFPSKQNYHITVPFWGVNDIPGWMMTKQRDVSAFGFNVICAWY